ncbi:hypothetical protein BB561_004506 [Smittium simulii]|uniref:Uncharacterized protein n=1 Tax=Smittium simulii TaxID=133385 RepID=A0A2T9YFU8_9FUNG|nr:hypothetical protein BB561_004506 [Smittium simulii]
MLSLAKGFYNYLNQKEEYTVLILGLADSGKTFISEQIKEIYTGLPALNSDTIQPTIGVNIRKININKIQLKFIDLGGDEQLRDIWEAYYSPCNGILFVVDLAKPESINQTFEVFKNILSAPELSSLPVSILGNRAETENAFPLYQLKENLNKLLDIIEDRDCRVFQISNQLEIELPRAISWIYHRMLDNKLSHPPIMINT